MQRNKARAHSKTDSIPRWVKIFAFVFASLLALFALVHLTGTGFPARTARDRRARAAPITMSAWFRKLVLVFHVVTSVGWLGAVACFLALAIVGQLGANETVARATYVAMELVGWLVVVPFAFLSLGTGIIQSLGTQWGLLTHYWIEIKLFLTVFATVVLLVHMYPTSEVAEAAASSDATNFGGLHSLRVQLIADAAAGLLTLVFLTALSIYKPRGVTRFRPRRDEPDPPA